MIKTGVYLGRFSPFHKGHQETLRRVIERHGINHVLVLIGSTNTRNSRTPYTFEQRKTMIQNLFPDVRIMPLPDGKANLMYFDGSTNEMWLDNVEKIQNDLKESFVFYGGKKEDLEILAERFPTEIIMDRNIDPNLSSTNIRKAMDENDLTVLEKYLDPNIIPLAITGYKEFRNQNGSN